MPRAISTRAAAPADSAERPTSLADDEHVERGAQRTRDFVGDRYAPARKTEHHHARPTRVLAQLSREDAAGIRAVAE